MDPKRMRRESAMQQRASDFKAATGAAVDLGWLTEVSQDTPVRGSGASAPPPPFPTRRKRKADASSSSAPPNDAHAPHSTEAAVVVARPALPRFEPLDEDCLNRISNLPHGQPPTIELVQECVDFMEQKWLRNDLDTARVMHNFHLTYDPASNELTFKRGHAHMKGHRDALEYAHKAELALTSKLHCYTMTDMIEVENYRRFQKFAKRTMHSVSYMVANAHRMIEHFLTMKQEHNIRLNGLPDPNDKAVPIPDYPMFLSGLMSQEQRVMRRTTKTDRSLAYLYNLTATMRLRHKGNVLFQEVRVHPHAPVYDDRMDLVCAHPTCRRSHAWHEALGGRCSCAFKPKFDVDRTKLVGTYAWKELDRNATLEEFVRMHTNGFEHEGAHADINDRVNQIVGIMSTCVGDARLPVLRTNQSMDKHGHTVAFLNGVWFCKSATFRTYEELGRRPKLWKDLVAFHRPLYFFESHYANEELGPADRSARTEGWPEEFRFRNVHKNDCCKHCRQTKRYHAPSRCVRPRGCAPEFSLEICYRCKRDDTKCRCVRGFKPYYVDYVNAVHDIKTPNYDRMLNAQWGDFPDARGIKFWYHVATGRWFVDNDNAEKWGAMLWVGGHSGTGKSEMARVCSDFIPDDLFIALNPVGEQDFGREDLFEPDGTQRWMQILECNGRANIPQHELKEMSTAGKLSFARKYRGVLRVHKYLKKLWLSGNNVPPFIDTSFDMIRRILAFEMENAVVNKDGKLQERIEEFEAPAILYKKGRSYMFARELWGACDLNDPDPFSSSGEMILPQTLLAYKYNLVDKLNAPMSFLHNLSGAMQPMVLDTRSDVDPKDRMFVSLDDFTSNFIKYRRQHFGKEQDAVSVNKDTFAAVFKQMGLDVVKEMREYNKKKQFAKYLVGVGLCEDNANTEAIADLNIEMEAEKARGDSGSSSSSSIDRSGLGDGGRTERARLNATEEVQLQKHWREALRHIRLMCASGKRTFKAEHVRELFTASNTPITDEARREILRICR